MSETNGFAKRDAFLGPCVREYIEPYAEGYGRVCIQSITQLERSRFEASNLGKDGAVVMNKILDMKCRAIVLGLVDPINRGSHWFSNADIEQLRQQNSKYIDALADLVMEHWGFNKKTAEELEKNLEATAGASSP